MKDKEKVPVEILSEYSRKILELVLYDVENCQALRNFARVKDHTDCIFAKKSILWGAQDYDQELSVGVLGNGCLVTKSAYCINICMYVRPEIVDCTVTLLSNALLQVSINNFLIVGQTQGILDGIALCKVAAGPCNLSIYT